MIILNFLNGGSLFERAGLACRKDVKFSTFIKVMDLLEFVFRRGVCLRPLEMQGEK